MALRRPLHASMLAVTALLASGCGGVDASTAPTTASEVDFCMTWVKQAIDAEALISASVQAGEMPSGEEILGVIDGWIPAMLAIGTPAGIPAGARAWFETYLEEDVDAGELDEAIADEDFDVTTLMDDLSSEEFDQSREFSTYVQSTCSPLYRERGLL